MFLVRRITSLLATLGLDVFCLPLTNGNGPGDPFYGLAFSIIVRIGARLCK